MNDLTVQTGGAVAVVDDFDPYAEYGRENSNNIVGKLLRFSKGDWMVGDDELPVDTQVIVNMDSLLIGWIKWADQKPVEQIMGLLKERHRPQKRDTLGADDEADWEVDKDNKPQDPWQETNYLPLKAVDGDELYTFTTSSVGGRGAISTLCRDFGSKNRMHPGKFPIVALGVDSYKHKDTTLGRIKFPVLKIIGWADKGAFEAGVDASTGEVKPTQAELELAADKLLNQVGKGTKF